MKKRLLIALGLALVLTAAIVAVGSAVGGAAFTTFNPSVDGDPADLCKNSIINCNIYSTKQYVWLNGGPGANHLKPDGYYFFTVLEPGGQPNPNDQGGVADKNLSDDFDAYTNRVFLTSGGEVVEYLGDHWLDSNTQAPNGCKKGNGAQACDGPDGLVPYIRLFPYSDTTNPGGVYIMSICYLGDNADPNTWDYPVEPRDCKYDAFKVKEGRMTYDIFLNGYKVHDLEADGIWNNGDYGLSGWTINITGTGFLGEDINDSVQTGEGGYWEWGKNYAFTGKDKPVTAHLTVCEELQADWIQSAPSSVCYDLTLETSALAEALDLNFLNYQPVDIKACKFTDDYNASTLPAPYEGWPVYLITDGTESGPFLTGEDGCYYWDDLTPGHEYGVREDDPLEWVPVNSALIQFGYVLSGDGPLYAEFVNVPAQGCTPGFWGGGSDGGQAGGQWLWNYEQDLNWQQAGGQDWNPYIWTTSFNSYFAPVAALDGWDMHSLVNTGGGSVDAQKAARSMTAAYLNASFGINYAYSLGELEAMWNAAVADGSDAAFLSLHTLLDAANNHYGNTVGDCPISAGNSDITQ